MVEPSSLAAVNAESTPALSCGEHPAEAQAPLSLTPPPLHLSLPGSFLSTLTCHLSTYYKDLMERKLH